MTLANLHRFLRQGHLFHWRTFFIGPLVSAAAHQMYTRDLTQTYLPHSLAWFLQGWAKSAKFGLNFQPHTPLSDATMGGLKLQCIVIAIFPSFYRATANAYARSCYRHMSVCLSVCQTRGLCQNEIIICRYFNTIRHSEVSSFLRPNFVILCLGVHAKQVCQRGVPSVESANLTNNLQ